MLGRQPYIRPRLSHVADILGMATGSFSSHERLYLSHEVGSLEAFLYRWMCYSVIVLEMQSKVVLFAA